MVSLPCTRRTTAGLCLLRPCSRCRRSEIATLLTTLRLIVCLSGHSIFFILRSIVRRSGRPIFLATCLRIFTVLAAPPRHVNKSVLPHSFQQQGGNSLLPTVFHETTFEFTLLATAGATGERRINHHVPTIVAHEDLVGHFFGEPIVSPVYHEGHGRSERWIAEHR